MYAFHASTKLLLSALRIARISTEMMMRARGDGSDFLMCH